MSVPALLAELRRHDLQVWADGDQLRCSAPAGVLTPELRDQLRRHKQVILDFLRSAEALARQQRAIVPLQPRGAHVPVFAVPGHSGDVFCYRALAQHLGDDQPFFGLQHPGVDGRSEPLRRVEDLAAHFVAQIRAFRPDGPYVLAGYCAGGSIAVELARQLQDQGAAVSFVALFASPYPTWYRSLPQLRLRIAHEITSALTHLRALAPLSYAGRLQYITEGLRRRTARREARRNAAPDPMLIARARVESATLVGVRRYVPPTFLGRVKLFLPSQEWLHPGNELLRWAQVARDIETYCGPDGCTGDRMLLEPYVSVMAERFRSCRDRSAVTVPA